MQPIHPIDSLLSKYQNKPGSQGQENPEYATMVKNLDRNIGLLISLLKTRHLVENTRIIFTSDNGGLYGITKQPPLHAVKGSYYEGGVREPFFFVWKGKIESGLTSSVPITNMDIFPTVLDILGIDKSQYQLDGESLIPVLEGKFTAMDRALYWHFPIYLQAYNVHDNENRDLLFRTRLGSVVRYKNWKLHYYFDDDGNELYNLDEDIGERNNLADENSAKRDELMMILENLWESTNAPIPKDLNQEYEID